MRSKRSSRNSTKSGLLFLSLAALLAFSGCSADIPATYKEEDIPYQVKKICKDEYNLEVTTKRTATTLWIYAPLTRILHKEYGIKQDKVFDEEVADKLRYIITTIGRVLISSDNTPDFFVLLASDIKLGIDYMLIGNTLDIKKAYSGFLPWTESNRRYVIKFDLAPQAIGDEGGEHMQPYDITMPEFLAEQIAQRISAAFQDEDTKGKFKVEKSTGKFEGGTFYFEYGIKPIKSDAATSIDIEKKALDIIAYCLKSYEFKDFISLRVTDIIRETTTDFGRTAILSRPTG